jgi:hypothetical protein
MGVNGEKARKLYESDEKNSAVSGLSWFPYGERVWYGAIDKSGYALFTRELSGGPVTHNIFLCGYEKNARPCYVARRPVCL